MESLNYSVHDVADYVIFKLKSEDNISLINLKLQKLSYYIQAWHIGIRKKKFFNGDFEAWIHGPVNVDLFHRFRENKSLYSDIELNDIVNKDFLNSFSPKDKKFIDFILENYAKFSGVELETMTHKELPWKETRKGFDPTELCNKVIPDTLLLDYYGKKWKEISKN